MNKTFDLLFRVFLMLLVAAVITVFIEVVNDMANIKESCEKIIAPNVK